MDDNQTYSDSRRVARLLAIQFLFTKFFAEKNQLDYLAFEPATLLQLLEEKKFNGNLYEAIIEGVEKHLAETDKVIQEAAPAWPLDQINPVNLIILRAAIWEAFISCMTPPKVVINEAIELDKALSSKTNSNFINGVLGSIFSNEEIKNKLANLNKNE
jgi:transcription antitermination protein NusB